MRLTKKLKELVIARIESGDQIIDIADALGVTRQALYKARRDHKAFREAWDAAKEIGDQIQLSACEKEADFRARIGWLEPKFFEGRICGFVPKFSDSLLQLRLKALAPERYADRSKVDHSGAIKGSPDSIVIQFVSPNDPDQSSGS